MRAGESRDNGARFDYRQKKIFLFSIKPKPTLWLTQPSVQWILKIHSPEVKRPGREVDYSRLSNAEFRMSGAIPPCPLHAFKACTGIMLLVVRVEIIYFGSDLNPEALAGRTNILLYETDRPSCR